MKLNRLLPPDSGALIEPIGVNQDWEIIRTSYGLKESVSTRTSNTKTI
jgi:hypothetical protein